MTGGPNTTQAPQEEVQVRPQQLLELSCFPPSNVNQSEEQLNKTFKSLSWGIGGPEETPVIKAIHPHSTEVIKQWRMRLIFRIPPEKEGKKLDCTCIGIHPNQTIYTATIRFNILQTQEPRKPPNTFVALATEIAKIHNKSDCWVCMKPPKGSLVGIPSLWRCGPYPSINFFLVL